MNPSGKSWMLLVLASLLGFGCAGGQNSAPATGDSAAQSVSVSISPSAATVAAGTALKFTASVNGTKDGGVVWSVQEGASGGQIDASGVYVAPKTKGTYHVVATSAADPKSKKVATVVSVTSTGTSTSTTGTSTGTGATQPSSAIPLGINLGAPSPYAPWAASIYADMVKSSWGAGGFSSGAVAVDALAWPTEASFKIPLFNDIGSGAGARYTGTYTVYYSGSISSFSLDTDGTASVNGSGSGLTFTIGGSPTYLFVKFQGATRPDGTPGLNDVRVMRPIAPGSTTSHAASDILWGPTRTFLQNFGVIRLMDYLATNWNQQQNWSDRTPPGRLTHWWLPPGGGGYGWQNVGGPWEYAVAIANEANRDIWINIPQYATDEYIANVARVIKYGSDGVNPYSSPQANPVWPPLNPNLKVYVEYSNEMWLGLGASGNGISAVTGVTGVAGFTANQAMATTDINSGLQYINYDGSADEGGARRVYWMACRISAIFRSIVGDDDMHTGAYDRVRPVFMGQGSWAAAWINPGLRMGWEYLNDQAGKFTRPAPFPAAAHPPSWYLYALGGAPYFQNDAPQTTVAGVLTNGTFDVAAMVAQQYDSNAKAAASFGLRYVTYEGGPEIPNGDATLEKAVNASDRPDAVNIRDVMINQWTAFAERGGALFTYYQGAGDGRWAFGDVQTWLNDGDLTALDTPKMRAVADIVGGPRPAVTFGSSLPASMGGSSFALSDGSNGAFGGSNGNWKTYIVNAASDGTLSVTLTVSSASSPVIDLAIDGVLQGPKSAPPFTWSGIPVSAGLHGVLVQRVSGSFSLDGVAVQ